MANSLFPRYRKKNLFKIIDFCRYSLVINRLFVETKNKKCMNIAIILSGGVGSRMGLNIPKQYVMVNKRPVVSYCLQTFFVNKRTDAVVIGVADEWKEFVKEQVDVLHPDKNARAF